MPLSIRAVLPDPSNVKRPSVVLVHGAANSATVWTYWQIVLAQLGYGSYAIDLRGHGKSPPADLGRTSMQDYADDIADVIAKLAEPPVVIGWSMGGLVALMAASRGNVHACAGLAPSTPSAVRDPSAVPREGTFDASEYGIASSDPAKQSAMPDLDVEERQVALDSLCDESRYARDERAAGVVVAALACPLLVVTGTADTQWPLARYDDMPLPADYISAEDASHWGLVLNRRVLPTLVPRVVAWFETGGG